MKKTRIMLTVAVLTGSLLTIPAAALSHEVVPGDTMWKLAVQYQVGTSEIIQANPQVDDLHPLSANWELSRVARYKSQDMRDRGYFSHTSPTYGSPFQMITAFGLSYRTAGENIARGYASPQAVVDGWMNSSGHRANILNASYTQIGVGYVAKGNYWTQLFIG